MKLLGSFIVVFLLTACGGGSDESSFVVTPPVAGGGGNGDGSGGGNGDSSDNEGNEVVTMTLVPYLSGITVCADVDNDGACSSDEIIGVTDENSKIDIEEGMQENVILAVNPKGFDIWGSTVTYIPKFTFSSVQGFDVISALSTLSNASGFTPDQIAATWDFPVEHLFGDFNLLDGDNNRNYGYAVAALDEFVFDLIGDEVDVSDFVERIARVTPTIKSAMADGISLHDLAISLDPAGLVVTNLEGEFIELVTTEFMRQKWNFYHFGDTPQWSQPPQTYGKITIDWAGDLCFNASELNSQTAFKADRIPNCRFNYVNNNVVSFGVGDLRLQFSFGETTDKGTVLVFKAEDSDGESLGFYWFDNFEDDAFTGEVFVEQDWLGSAFYTVGSELGLYQLYKSQYFVGGEYVITDANTDESSFASNFESGYVFDNGISLNGDILTFDDALGNSFNKSVFRSSENVSLFVVDGEVRSFGIMSKNPDIAAAIATGEIFTK